MHEFEMTHDLTCRRGGRCHQIMGFRQARCGSVIHYISVFAQHQPVFYASNRQSAKSIGIDKIQKLGRI